MRYTVSAVVSGKKLQLLERDGFGKLAEAKAFAKSLASKLGVPADIDSVGVNGDWCLRIQPNGRVQIPN